MQGNMQTGKVVHTYRDYSQEVETKFEASRHMSDTITADTASKGGCRAEENFPIKLHYMLLELQRDGLDHIVSWQPHGRCFVVHKQKEFVEHILPFWFRQSKFPSFQRQLNLYGFKRLTAGRDKGGYYHELFLRGKRFLAHRIQRIKIKGTGARKPSSPDTEPNFYRTIYLPLEPISGRQAKTNSVSTLSSQMPNILNRFNSALPDPNGRISLHQQLLATYPHSPQSFQPSPASLLPAELLIMKLQRERLQQDIIMASQCFDGRLAGLGLDGSGAIAHPNNSALALAAAFVRSQSNPFASTTR